MYLEHLLSLRFAVICACQILACMHVSRVILGDEHHYILIVLLTHSRAVDPTGSHVPTVGPAWLWQIILAQSSCWENQRQQFGSGQLYTPLQMWPPMCLFCKVLLCIVKHRLSTVVMLKIKISTDSKRCCKRILDSSHTLAGERGNTVQWQELQ